jgi:protein-disulfide isomerase
MNSKATLIAPVTERDHAQGSASAPLTLVEYGDYQCPFCGAAYPVVKIIQRRFGKNLRFVYRNFPLTQAHRSAEVAAEAAEAAGLLGKFWPMHDIIFENQSELSPEALVVWAHMVGLEDTQLGKVFGRPDIAKRISDDRRNGIRSGVNATPSFFINGVRYDGPPTYEMLHDALAAVLQEMSAIH